MLNRQYKTIILFAFWDLQKDLKKYVFSYLRGLQNINGEIIFISNSKLSDSSKLALKTLNITLYERENIGYDFGAWKDYITNNKKKISAFDRIILCNNSCYGPFTDLVQIMKEMSPKSLDFWGITKHLKTDDISEHLQSYFLVLESDLIHSSCFYSFWDALPYFKNWEDAVKFGEINFTVFFKNQGFKYDSYLNTEDLSAYVPNVTIFFPIEIINRGGPFLKRKVFTESFRYRISVSDGGDAIRTYNYLHLNYPLICDEILEDLSLSLSTSLLSLSHNQTFIVDDVYKPSITYVNNKTAVFLYVYYEEELEYISNYLLSIPEHIQVFLISPKESLLNLYSNKFNGRANINFRKHPNIGRNESAYFVTCKHDIQAFKYVCLCHDKRSKHIAPSLIGFNFMRHCFTNLLGEPGHNYNYIENVVALFENHKDLGILVPPSPYFSTLKEALPVPYGVNEANCKKIFKQLKCDSFKWDECGFFIPFGGMLWARATALKPLLDLDLKLSDFPEEPLNCTDGSFMHSIERIYPSAAAKAGFYSGRIINYSYLSIHINQLYYGIWSDKNSSLLQKLVTSLKQRSKKTTKLYPVLKTIYKIIKKLPFKKISNKF